MTDKQIIDVCPYQGECSVSGCKRNDDGCFVRQLFEERCRAENQIVELNKTIKAKEQECEFSNLRIIQLQETLSQYETDLSTKDCIVETCKAQYKELETENEKLKKGFQLATDTLEKTLQWELDLYKKHINSSFTGAWDWENDKVIAHIELYIEQLKAEFISKNEKIKELRFSVSDLTNRLCDLNAEKSFKIVDLEQALEKVREFAKSYMQDCDFSWGCDACDYKCFAQHIQQTCDEAKNGQIKQISQ